ncbi:MAG: hypothetical protein WC201_03175 [Bacilli bacterium]
MLVNLVLLFSCLGGMTAQETVDSEIVNRAVCEVTSLETQSTNALDNWNLASDYELIEEENPNFTQEQIISQLYLNKNSNSSYSYDGHELNNDEFWTIVLNLWPHQYETAKNLTERASTQAQIYYPTLSCYQDDGDAFRHTYWSALLTYEFGSSFALKLTSAHESDTPEGIDKEMDLHNNKNGTTLLEEWRSKFSSTSTDAWSDIGEFIYHCVANGEVYDCVKINLDTQKLVYTTVGGSNETKFSIRSNINQIGITDYAFEQQYFFYSKTKTINTTGGATIDTKRLRTGYIEEEYIVLSPHRLNAGTAYLEYIFDTPIDAICVDLTMWSNSELLSTADSTAIIYSSVDGIDYVSQLDLLNDITLSKVRTNPNQYRILFPENTTRIKFVVTSPATGDRNKGRICIGNMDVLFKNLNY